MICFHSFQLACNTRVGASICPTDDYLLNPIIDIVEDRPNVSMDKYIDMREPLPPAAVVLPYIAMGLVPALRSTYPGVSWRLAALVAFGAAMARFSLYDTGDKMQNYCIGSAFGSHLCNALVLWVLSDPVKECRYENQKEPTEDWPLWKRLYWMMCVGVSTRSIGWSTQVRAHS